MNPIVIQQLSTLHITLKPMQISQSVDYGYLKIPQCEYCGAYISNHSNIGTKEWQCILCHRAIKLALWYNEKPLQYRDIRILNYNNPPQIRRVLFMLDVTSVALCKMVIPLINLSFDRFEEVGIVACTPFPIVFQFNNRGGVSLCQLSQDSEWQTNQLFITKGDRQKIKQILEQLEYLCEYYRDIMKQDRQVEIALEFISRLQMYKSIKVIQLFQAGQFDQQQVNQFSLQQHFKQHYYLYIVDSLEQVGNYYAQLVNDLNGVYKVFNMEQLDVFYEDISDLILTRQLGWDAIVRVRTSKGCEVSNMIGNVRTLDEQTELSIDININGQQDPRFQICIEYIDYDKKYTILYNWEQEQEQQ